MKPRLTAPAALPQPDKEVVRAWLMQRWGRPGPLPDIAQIRRELGWRAGCHNLNTIRGNEPPDPLAARLLSRSI